MAPKYAQTLAFMTEVLKKYKATPRDKYFRDAVKFNRENYRYSRRYDIGYWQARTANARELWNNVNASAIDRFLKFAEFRRTTRDFEAWCRLARVKGVFDEGKGYTSTLLHRRDADGVPSGGKWDGSYDVLDPVAYLVRVSRACEKALPDCVQVRQAYVPPPRTYNAPARAAHVAPNREADDLRRQIAALSRRLEQMDTPAGPSRNRRGRRRN